MVFTALIAETVRPLSSAAPMVAAATLLGSIHLVERRGRKDQLDPKRHLDISTLLESIPEAAMIVDSNGVVDANSMAAHLIGKTRDEVRGMRLEEINRLFQEDNRNEKRSAAVVARALAGHPVPHERHIIRSLHSGATHELLVSANPIYDDQGHAIAALVIARDVTELTRLQQRVGDIERHRAVGQMAAALAHDFNNLLDTIGQAAAVLEMKADSPRQERKPLLDMIQNTVHRGAEMVQRIREYLRTGRENLHLLNVCDAVHDAVELTRPLWQKANVTVTTKLQPVHKVRADAADLRRVFTNLIINAIEAMPGGGQISLTCQQEGDRVITTVSDVGVGIPPDEQRKVFFPYFTTKPQGTGLGLSGAQKILLSYGGSISVASEMGKGTTFTVVLPSADGEQKVA